MFNVVHCIYLLFVVYNIVKCAVGSPTHNTLIYGGINGLTKWQLEKKSFHQLLKNSKENIIIADTFSSKILGWSIIAVMNKRSGNLLKTTCISY